MATRRQPPLLVICGPTASGKSRLAMRVARVFNGEIICADSRTIYKGMDIGTAKPTQQDQYEIKHHLLDLVEPGQRFTAYDFQKRAQSAIKDIRSRNKLPIIVGGTGLYIDSVVFSYEFPSITSSGRDSQNNRHAKKTTGLGSASSQKSDKPLTNTIIVGITTEIKELEQKIAKRAEYIFSHGVVEEAKKLGEIYGWHNESMTANIYPIIHQVLRSGLTIEEAKARFIILDRQLAKRQLTWLKRNSYISWFGLKEAERFLFNTLAKTPQK